VRQHLGGERAHVLQTGDMGGLKASKKAEERNTYPVRRFLRGVSCKTFHARRQSREKYFSFGNLQRELLYECLNINRRTQPARARRQATVAACFLAFGKIPGDGGDVWEEHARGLGALGLAANAVDTGAAVALARARRLQPAHEQWVLPERDQGSERNQRERSQGATIESDDKKIRDIRNERSGIREQ